MTDDPLVFTSEWAEKAVTNLGNLAATLTGPANEQTLRQIRMVLHELVGSYSVLTKQENRFDFDRFNALEDERRESGQPTADPHQPRVVKVFGKWHPSFHTAARVLVEEVVDTIWVDTFDDGLIVAEADIETIEVADMAATANAFARVLEPEFQEPTEDFGWPTAQLEFGWLAAQLEKELSAVKLGVPQPASRGQTSLEVSKLQNPERTADRKTDSGQGFPIVCLDPPQVTIDDTAYAVKKPAAVLLNALVKANGDWINGKKVVQQPTRVVAGMPKQVRKLVESSPGKGYRLRREK